MDAIRIDHWSKLGASLRQARVDHQWSQHELARRAGVSRSWLARVEGGHRGAELEPLLRLLQALGLDVLLAASTSRPPTAAPSSGQPATTRSPAAEARARAWGRGESRETASSATGPAAP